MRSLVYFLPPRTSVTDSVGIMHPADLILQAEGNNARLERLFHLALEPRIGVDDVPLHVRVAGRLLGSSLGLNDCFVYHNSAFVCASSACYLCASVRNSQSRLFFRM